MTNKQALKGIGFIILLIGSFALGRLWTGVRAVLSDMTVGVYTDMKVRESINSVIPHILPERAYKIYYGRFGFQESEIFIAFSAPKEDCLKCLDNLNGIEPDKMESSTVTEKRIIEFSPKRHRPDFDHSYWDISLSKEYLKDAVSFPKLTVYYDLDINRIYIYRSM